MGLIIVVFVVRCVRFNFGEFGVCLIIITIEIFVYYKRQTVMYIIEVDRTNEIIRFFKKFRVIALVLY